MKNSIFIFLIICFSGSIFGQQGDQLTQVRVDVVYLASDYLEGRGTGLKGETLAAEYIIDRMAAIGLSPKGQDGKWIQAFPFKELSNPHAVEKKTPREGIGKNVIGFIDNKAEHTIVIGGHYDHLGYGESGSRHAGGPAIHNGADDNASGIAAMLLLAERLKNSELKKYNYMFLAFSGEEMGLFGSKHYVENPTIPLENINALINMDMVGRMNEEKVLSINAIGTSPVWKEILDNNKTHGIEAVTTESGIGPSDHTPFYLKDVPVLHFFSGQHQDYHKPEDDAHLINFIGIIEIADYIYNIIEALNKQEKIAFTKTKDTTERKAAAFKVTLGVMPDYVYNGKGMKIDSVLDERPAKKGGIENGDIIIKLGDVEVTDIYKYMEALSLFKVGDQTTVIVERKGKKLKKKVTF